MRSRQGGRLSDVDGALEAEEGSEIEVEVVIGGKGTVFVMCDAKDDDGDCGCMSEKSGCMFVLVVRGSDEPLSFINEIALPVQESSPSSISSSLEEADMSPGGAESLPVSSSHGALSSLS